MRSAMRIADQLKALREAIPGSPGVRQIARELGYEKHNGYGYYEGATFNKPTLPLDKAREFAAVFSRLGGDGQAVLKLAGLSDDEIAREPMAIDLNDPVYLPMPVAFPNEDAIVAVMRGLLRGVGLEEEADKYAATLAQRLPKALARASEHLIAQQYGENPSHVEPVQPDVALDLDHPQ